MLFEKTLMAGWGDMDSNSHMRNTAFLDRSSDVRMMFFAERGYSVEEFSRLSFGPVVRKDELEYFREIRLLEQFRVTLELAGVSEDGSRFILCNEFSRAGDELAARVTSHGGWLDLTGRKLIAPPAQLVHCLMSLTRTAGFRALSSIVN